MAWAGKLLGYNRFIPLLTLVLLSFPVDYLTTLCHELGHGLVGLAQGSPFTGIFLGANVAYALVNNSPLVSVGGWIGQYALAAGVGLASWKAKPRSFTVRSLVFIIMIENLIGVPFAIASLNGDSSNLLLMTSPPLGAGLVVAVLEGAAAALLIIGSYFTIGIAQDYFRHVFPWITKRRSRYLALFAIALVAVEETIGFQPYGIGPLLLIFFFIMGFTLIPARPSSYPAMTTLPSRTTFAIVIAVFLLTESFTYLVLPITISL